MATQALLRCINEGQQLRTKTQADAPLQASAGDPQVSDSLAFLARVNINLQADILGDRRKLAAMSLAARIAATVNAIDTPPSGDGLISDAEPTAPPEPPRTPLLTEKHYAIHVRDDRGGRLRACCPVCMAFGCRGKYDPQCTGVNDSGHRSREARMMQEATGSGKDRRSHLCFRCQKMGHFARTRPCTFHGAPPTTRFGSVGTPSAATSVGNLTAARIEGPPSATTLVGTPRIVRRRKRSGDHRLQNGRKAFFNTLQAHSPVTEPIRDQRRSAPLPPWTIPGDVARS